MLSHVCDSNSREDLDLSKVHYLFVTRAGKALVQRIITNKDPINYNGKTDIDSIMYILAREILESYRVTHWENVAVFFDYLFSSLKCPQSPQLNDQLKCQGLNALFNMNPETTSALAVRIISDETDYGAISYESFEDYQRSNIIRVLRLFPIKQGSQYRMRFLQLLGKSNIQQIMEYESNNFYLKQMNSLLIEEGTQGIFNQWLLETESSHPKIEIISPA